MIKMERIRESCMFMIIYLFASVTGEYAFITFDPTLEGRTQCNLPSLLEVKVEYDRDTVSLDLIRNDHVHPNVPTYFIRATDVRYELQHQSQEEMKFQAAYQDRLHEAAVFVHCHQHPVKGTQIELEGTLFLGSVKYRLHPSSSPLTPFQKLFHSERQRVYHLVRAKEDTPFDSGLKAKFHDRILKKSMDEIRLPDDHAERVKRDTASKQTINIDLLVLLEYSVINTWKTKHGSESSWLNDAKTYFAHIINAAGLRFKNIEHDVYSFNLRLVGFYISEEASTSPWSENNVTVSDNVKRTHATSVLKALQQWNKINSTGPGIPHDHLLLFTSYDLVGEDNGFRFNYTTGFAYTGSMCNTEGFSVSVVEDRGGFQSVGTVAHELGHSLGADHDGDGNTCRPEERYIMAPVSFNETVLTKFNPWFFSPCSVILFVNFITEHPDFNTCLTGSLTVADLPDTSGTLPGQIYPPDLQCQQLYGGNSYLCRGPEFDVSSVICRAMFCYRPDDGDCVSLTAARGTSCGNNKWCSNGQCVQNDTAPSVDDSCPHGDQPYVRVNEETTGTTTTTTCDAALTVFPGNCYNPGWESTCCATCKTVCDGPTDCKCGDRILACVEAECGSYTPGDLEKCCYTCRNYEPTTTSSTTTVTETTTSTTTSTPTTTQPSPSTCSDVTSYNGVTCGGYLNNRGVQQCYDASVNTSCCATCRDRGNTAVAGCEWGDKTPSSCHLLNSLSAGSVCPQGILTDKCCQTCSELMNSINLPPPVNTGNGNSNNNPSTACNPHTASLLVLLLIPLVHYTFGYSPC